MNRTHFAFWIGAISCLFILGCAGDYGKISTVEEGGLTVATLVDNWSNYNIYYAGSKPEMPVAVLFDPKNDGKNLQVDPRWEKVTDQKTPAANGQLYQNTDTTRGQHAKAVEGAGAG